MYGLFGGECAMKAAASYLLAALVVAALWLMAVGVGCL